MKKGIYLLAWIIGVGIVIFVGMRLGYYLTNYNNKKTLETANLINLVDADGIKLNIYKFGNTSDPKHKIVFISDLDDDDTSVIAPTLFESLTSENEIIVIDRPGYGFSDDTKKDMTNKYIVDSYRKVLSNSDIEGPYVLVSDGFGNVYANYWLNTYEDEVESMILINPYDLGDQKTVEKDEHKWDTTTTEYFYTLVNEMGFNTIFLGYEDIKPWAGLNDTISKYSEALAYKNYHSNAKYSEKNNAYKNALEVIENIKVTNIPKLYITSLLTSSSEYREYVNFKNSLYTESNSKIRISTETKDIDLAFANYQVNTYEPAVTSCESYLRILGNIYLEMIPGYDRLYLNKSSEINSTIKDFISKQL